MILQGLREGTDHPLFRCFKLPETFNRLVEEAFHAFAASFSTTYCCMSFRLNVRAARAEGGETILQEILSSEASTAGKPGAFNGRY